jgi:anaphase-promoting complex subunit 3
MDAFSSVLWQLQRDVPLSFLAQELIDIDSRAPEAWIAIGNLFSLQRDRQQALTCFRHATDIDPANAYAWTLGGQETLEEDAIQAVPFFEKALRADARHYNAW